MTRHQNEILYINKTKYTDVTFFQRMLFLFKNVNSYTFLDKNSKLPNSVKTGDFCAVVFSDICSL